MSKEIVSKTKKDEKGTLIIVEANEVPTSTEKDGRYGVTAYSKNDGHNSSMYSPTFWINSPQRVPVQTWAENGKVFGASLFNRKEQIGISVPPEGGIFDLIPGYWNLSLTGTYYVPGGIFASATYQ